MNNIKRYREHSSIERLNQALRMGRPSVGINAMYEDGTLREILPEVVAMRGKEYVGDKGHKDNYLHTLKVLDNVALRTDKFLLRLAALLHDIGKPATKRYDAERGWTFHGHEHLGEKMSKDVMRRLGYNEEDVRYVSKLVRMHLRPMFIVGRLATDSAIRRLMREAGELAEDLMILASSDVTSKNDKKVERYMRNFNLVQDRIEEVKEKDVIREYQPPISGDEIMRTFGIGPSRPVGIIRNAIKDAILNGEIGDNYEEAREYMFKKAKEIGLKPVI